MTNVFFKNNREKLGIKLENGSAVILFAGKAPHRSADAHYDFFVNRNFFYMAGTEEEGQKLIIIKKEDKIESTLYIADFDEHYSKWIGRQMSQEQAKEISGADKIRNNSAFEADVNRIANDYKINTLYLDLDRNSFDQAITISQAFAKEMQYKYGGLEIKNIYREICKQRFVKTPEEIAYMQKAVDITNDGLNALMKEAAVGKYEYELEAAFDHQLYKQGVRENAFTTIMASGDNACILHYVVNNDIMEENELVLCDLGATWKNYCADITRTYPVNGKFTDRQRVLYDIVLRGGKMIIEAAKPGVTTGILNKMLIDFYALELKNIGLIKEDKEVSNYYFHGVSHPLGLDTHDVGDREMLLEAGAVITVEPGLYIAEEGIGIRIEDDILITETGCVNLSAHIIKEMEDIENYMKK